MRLYILLLLVLIKTVLSKKRPKPGPSCNVAERYEADYGDYSECSLDEGQFATSRSYEILMQKHFNERSYHMNVSIPLKKIVCAINHNVRSIKQGCDFKYRQVDLGRDRDVALRFLAENIKKDLKKAKPVKDIIYFDMGCSPIRTLVRCAVKFTPKEKKEKEKPPRKVNKDSGHKTPVNKNVGQVSASAVEEQLPPASPSKDKGPEGPLEGLPLSSSEEKQISSPGHSKEGEQLQSSLNGSLEGGQTHERDERRLDGAQKGEHQLSTLGGLEEGGPGLAAKHERGRSHPSDPLETRDVPA